MNLQERIDRYRHRGVPQTEAEILILLEESAAEIDAESIAFRIATVTAKRCTVELRPVLPQALFGELAENDFEALRQSLRTVFSQWLEAAK